ncbi:hypothetical protein WKK05_09870 [Nostoc sp. UHCC 0302]|uniref:hypothetical protein n=1 Tax=Nostoc sp. UHCC 0302 TaxID=3134896 RepID=UPI00311CE0F6
MLRSNSKWLLPVTVCLVTFGSIRPAVSAQINYTFSANYDTLNTSVNAAPNIVQVSPSWKSTNASFGLNTLSGLVYGLTDFNTGKFTFDTNPTKFGLQGFPAGSVVIEGSGGDKLFASDSAVGLIDFQTLTATTTGVYTITGGEGKFKGASGKLDFSEIGKLSLDPNTPFQGKASVTGSFQVNAVPEPKYDAALLALGVLGVGTQLRRRSLRAKRRILTDSFVDFPTNSL